MSRIKNTDSIEPGTFVRGARGRIVREVIETRFVSGQWLMARLRDTRNGKSVGWNYLDTMVIVDADGNEVTS